MTLTFVLDEGHPVAIMTIPNNKAEREVKERVSPMCTFHVPAASRSGGRELTFLRIKVPDQQTGTITEQFLRNFAFVR